MSLLDAKAIAVSLNGRPVVREVSLTLGAGDMLGLIGANGAGKTTLLRAITGLVPHRGEVRLHDKPRESYGRHEWARRVAYMAQGHPVAWPLAVERVVALGRLPHGGVWRRESDHDRRAVARALEEAEIADLAGRNVLTLSAGERARTMFARALAVEADVLIADEPVTSLDPYHQLHVMELLAAYGRGGRGVIVVLHDLALAARFCTRLMLMKGGRVLTEGTPDSVLTDRWLADAYAITALRSCYEGEPYVLPWRRTS